MRRSIGRRPRCSVIYWPSLSGPEAKPREDAAERVAAEAKARAEEKAEQEKREAERLAAEKRLAAAKKDAERLAAEMRKRKEEYAAAAAAAAEQKEAAAKRPARKGSKPRAPRAGSGSKAKPLTDGYTLSGEPPAGADVAAIEKRLAERVEAKLARDFDKADGLQATLVEMGVFCNDRMWTWSSEPAAKQLAAK